MARTHRFATETVDVPAQEGERVTVAVAAPLFNPSVLFPLLAVLATGDAASGLIDPRTRRSKVKRVRESLQNSLRGRIELIDSYARVCFSEKSIMRMNRRRRRRRREEDDDVLRHL
ncbi:hypothetical protein Ahy_B05g076831 [Arachis hypogaea]|uniref:Uncharacterized protein n=1 Tax=Arachis hypogaea TaxID=3818 RepID=A0A444Z425_ARAHY|nr:hypothetical protein Ahy_B05g076831 [Arachis hypogaea]